ncbi:hypothetical protein BDV29DRAFT_200088 [Aspergillus leporis]|uniref:Putative gamma-glutamylcyclotransferase n=1 Tax=Aspergillus leporis TaxID=41062 RepID=A0A5N5WJX2_9EURO|nr:hypothetical protein BDV29DRAFT_200088 [Aspergillus leporis]
MLPLEKSGKKQSSASAPPIDPRSKISPFVLKLRSAPPGYFYQVSQPSPTVDLFAAATGPYFFYGTLNDSSMPELRPAFILGYECKLWGQYPALVDAPNSVVEGAAYNVQTVEEGERLAAYETSNYRTEPCLMKYTDGKEPAEDLGYTFKFAGNPKDLSEGSFDLRVWLKMMGTHAAVDKLDAKKRRPGGPARSYEHETD